MSIEELAKAYSQALKTPDTVVWITLIFGDNVDQRLKIAKFALKLSSPVFLAAFKDNTFANATSHEYVVTDYSDAVVLSAVKHLECSEFDEDIKQFDAAAIKFYMGVYLFANEYQMRFLKQQLTKSLTRWMDHLLSSDKPTFNQLFETIITLYESNDLSDSSETYDDSLFVSTARFCAKERPAYIEKCCKSPEQRYREFTWEIAGCYEELKEPCSLSKRCSYWDQCYCYQPGNWDDEFVVYLSRPSYNSDQTWDEFKAQ